jgi:cupin fold WbuC family metalloprotein
VRARTLSEEVLVAEGPIVTIGSDDIAELKRASLVTARKRIRICTHTDTDDLLHEMLIVHAAGAYVRPHKHEGKSESMHVLEGEADVVFFDDEGSVREVVQLGAYGSARRFYYRVDTPVFHTLLIHSDFLVFHEVTNGPFRREETAFAPWAPEEDDEAECLAFQQRLVQSIGGPAQ